MIKEIFIPIYLYKCSDCNHEFEEIQKITSDAYAVCPKCKSDKCSRVICPMLVKDGRPGWERSEDIKRYVNKCHPKYLKDEKGNRTKFPKGGV